MAASYVTKAELAASLGELDRAMQSRLYTVRDELIVRMDCLEEHILAELRNGHQPSSSESESARHPPSFNP